MKLAMNRRNAVKCIVAGAALPGAVLGASCNGSKGAAGSTGSGGVPGSLKAAKTAEWEKKSPGFNLVDRLNLATLRHKGIFIDFGTTDHFKYTMGRWRTGWGKSLTKEGVSFTLAKGSTGRVYFPWFEKADALMRIRMAPQKASLASVYVNNKPMSKIDIKSQGWATYTVKIPKSMLGVGENQLLLRWQGAGDIPEGDEAAWVDYIHLVEVPEGTAAPQAEVAPLPTQSSIAGSVELKKGSKALSLSIFPDFTLSYYLHVPEAKEEPELGFYMKAQSMQPRADKAGQPAAGATYTFKMTALTDTGPEATLLDEKVTQGSLVEFEPRGIDLTGLAGQVVRLDIAFSGGASPQDSQVKLVLARPAVYVTGKNFKNPPAIIRGKDRKVARSVILIMIDTLRADYTRCYGTETIKTPVLERIAEEGALLESFSAVEDWTKPSCATMLTGLYPGTHKAQTENVVLSKSVKMISEELKGRGLTTAAFISNGYVSDKFGFKRGWDTYENYIREKKPTEAEYVFSRVADWVDKNRDKRFFSYVHTIDPHVPYSPPEDFLKLYDSKPYSGPIKPRMTHIQLEEIKKGSMKVNERDQERLVALYKGEVSYHDKYLGSFMQKMADMGMLEDTMLIVTADHGEEFWEHGSVGHGHSVFQELVHVPLLFMWKGTIEGGKRIPENFDHTVIVPTIMDAMGLDAPNYLEGRSILPRLFGQHDTYPHMGLTTHQNERMGVWSRNLKLQMNGPLNTFLYDLSKDPQSKDNVYKKHPITLRYMKSLLGLKMGAPDRREWKSTVLLSENVGDVLVEEVQWDDELKNQLKILGYIQ